MRRKFAPWCASATLVLGCNAIVGVEDDYHLAKDAGANGNGGAGETGGKTGTGGATSTGGRSNGGNTTGTGGASESGGAVATGGATGDGGDASPGSGGNGGATTDGGDAGPDSGEGGASTGGVTASGGTTSSGGSGSGGCASQNVCGGCTVLTGKVGDACTPCGTKQCSGQNLLVCQSTCTTAAKPVCEPTTNACVQCTGAANCGGGTPVCLKNVCVQCSPGATSCAGTTPRLCSQSGTWGNQAITGGQCGATCTPQNLRCQNQIGQACATDGGSWISSGSGQTCGCATPQGRFLKTAANRVKDTQSGLTWDFPLNAAATYPNASANCTGKGMRLPTQNEWKTIITPMTQTAACAPNLQIGIDSVAFPEIAAGGSSPRYWTGEAENGFPGYLYVVYFTPGTTPGSGTTDRATTDSVAYNCVSGP